MRILVNSLQYWVVMESVFWGPEYNDDFEKNYRNVLFSISNKAKLFWMGHRSTFFKSPYVL